MCVWVVFVVCVRSRHIGQQRSPGSFGYGVAFAAGSHIQLLRGRCVALRGVTYAPNSIAIRKHSTEFEHINIRTHSLSACTTRFPRSSVTIIAIVYGGVEKIASAENFGLPTTKDKA